MNQVFIETAKKDDCQKMVELLYSSYQYMCERHNLTTLARLTTKQAVTNEVMMPYGKTWVIHHENALSGVLAIEKNSIERLFIDPGKFRLGLGKKLLWHGIREIMKSGHSYCRLEVLEQNHSARAYYVYHGWQENRKYTVSLIRKKHVPVVEYLFYPKSCASLP